LTKLDGGFQDESSNEGLSGNRQVNFVFKGGRLLRIRLARTGTKKKPSYRIVVIERERPRDGGFVEIVGHYNPRREPVELMVKQDRVDYWLGRGAQPSETVRSLLKRTEQGQG
jgi:small subunit ribosomal protein S16